MMPADQLVIAIRRIIVRGGSTLEILRFLDDATDPVTFADQDYAETIEQESYLLAIGRPRKDHDADLDVPLGPACRIDDDTCEACQ